MDTLQEVKQHYQMWTEDNAKRMTRTGGWNDITDAYYGKLPSEWPYLTRISDPRIRTSLIEKNARLLNSKLRGKLVPREASADLIKAQINNSILEYQWDNATHGGSMMLKLGIVDMDTRLYASKFILNEWLYKTDKDGNLLFEGNEMTPLDIRDCGIDPMASHIRDAKWFQIRTWTPIEDLEALAENKTLGFNKGAISKLKDKLSEKQSSTRTEYTPRGKQLTGLEDRMGQDKAFPVAKIVKEFREDKWIIFSADYDIILSEFDNPYAHRKIPVSQLRYYHLQDDPLGESEVEPVLPIWKAIQATICAYMDEVILKMRPPLKIIENAVRIETIQYGPEAQWLVNRQDAVEEMRTSGDTLSYFQTTYQVLISAFNVAMGDLSQGISNLGPFDDSEKTATEIRAVEDQRNTRDQKNQNDLAEFLKDMMSMWLSNNQQFLFSNSEKSEHVLRIVGEDKYAEFKRAGLADKELVPGAEQMIADIIEQDPSIGDAEIETLYDTASIPRFPIVSNPEEKDPTKLEIKSKLQISKVGAGEAELTVIPEDLEGTYDYVPDVKSMGLGADRELAATRQQLLQLVTSNEIVLQLLAEEGVRPDVKEMIKANVENSGINDAERFFRKYDAGLQQQQGAAEQGNSQMGGSGSPRKPKGIPGVFAPNAPENPKPMA